jgi:hypothetical protein
MPHNARGSAHARTDHRTRTTPRSRWRDTGPSNLESTNYSYLTISGHLRDSSDVPEKEIPTTSLTRSLSRRGGRFLKGPIPLVDLQRAALLPGKALPVYLCIVHQADLTGTPTVTLAKSLLASFGVSGDAKARALHQLENAGLISVERTRGRTARVSLGEHIGRREREQHQVSRQGGANSLKEQR